MNQAIREFKELIGRSSELLAIPEKQASHRVEGKWSRKEVLGHLIDSASNNHQRFVRLQLETGLRLPGYAQNEWVQRQNYQGRDWSDLVALWLAYNRHLQHVVENLDAPSLAHTWHSPKGEVSLEFIIADYLRHLRHHLEQILIKDGSAAMAL